MADSPTIPEPQAGLHPGPPLDGPENIRLISLMPGEGEHGVFCELISTELGKAPPYEALSYTWGDTSDVATVSVRIPATAVSGGLSVTSSCLRALRRLRLKDKHRMLWIDAMCIDQSDVTERNHQVTLMSRIYSGATRVVIYLGEAAHGSDVAMDFLLDNFSPTEGVFHSQTPDLLDSLNCFFLRSWFTRVWILQEVLLSQDAVVYCGDKTLPWEAIRDFNRFNVSERWLVKLPFVVSALVDAEQDAWAVRSLLKVLANGRHCKASNPRDKVYALLSLQGFYYDDAPLILQPNYAESVPAIFTNCAASLLNTDDFNVLSAVQGTSNFPHLPSWVPDWSLPLTGNPNQKHLALQAKGYFVGKITTLGSTYTAGQPPFPLAEWARLKPCPPNNNEITSSYPPEHAFPHLLGVANFSNTGLSSYLHGQLPQDLDYTPPLNYQKWIRGRDDGAKANPQEGFHRLVQETAERLRAVGALGEGEALGYADIPFHRAAKEIGPSPGAYVRCVLQHCHERRFFVTDTGYIGLAPSEAEIGDEVWLFVGAGFPFILRESEQFLQDVQRLHRLVGEGYMEDRPWMAARGKPRDEAETVTIV
ncbi:heterokaryon incompatibility protein-domain-containing protein [Podospora aff. communis PSN243]|uniref:Heterokaryon incompatibility protein-domain-containing protein n=1 Tax=Podospora aff. communis PSN243 TaxID=3040156 RepID=A0AAV9GPN7_9PEZI|nr:heterokaryon incompatibility protein-domain-containing protein [Podospora aff. communis PSN243]